MYRNMAFRKQIPTGSKYRPTYNKISVGIIVSVCEIVVQPTHVPRSARHSDEPVSYTHLDVYKRQM